MKKQILFVASIFLAVIVISCKDNNNLADEKSGHQKQEEEVVRGPHSGRLFSIEGLELELTIFESGVPPEFRGYIYEDKKPVKPENVQLHVEVHRLGGVIDKITFHPERDYLRGQQEIYEPHSFDVVIQAQYKSRSGNWKYSQVEGRVQLDSEALKRSGVTIETAGPAVIKSSLMLPGEIALNQDRTAHIFPQVTGMVTAVNKKIGDSVNKGEVLAMLSSRDLAEARREYVEALHRLELSKISYEREKTLWEKKISSEEEYLTKKHDFEEASISAETAMHKLRVLGSKETSGTFPKDQDLSAYVVRAPFNGTVVEKDIAVGEFVKMEDRLFVIADLSNVWVNAMIYAKDLAQLRVGQEVLVKSKDLNLENTGKLSFIGSLVGESTRTATGRIVLPNDDGLWRPGLFVDIEVTAAETQVPVAVTAESIQTFRDWSVVFAQFGDYFEVRPLELGRKDDQWVEVVEGIPAGTRYAAKNSFVLKAEVGKSGATHDH